MTYNATSATWAPPCAWRGGQDGQVVMLQGREVLDTIAHLLMFAVDPMFRPVITSRKDALCRCAINPIPRGWAAQVYRACRRHLAPQLYGGSTIDIIVDAVARFFDLMAQPGTAISRTSRRLTKSSFVCCARRWKPSRRIGTAKIWSSSGWQGGHLDARAFRRDPVTVEEMAAYVV